MNTKHPLSINGMHHVSLRVRDMEQSLAFYRDILGFSPKTEFTRWTSVRDAGNGQ